MTNRSDGYRPPSEGAEAAGVTRSDGSPKWVLSPHNRGNKRKLYKGFLLISDTRRSDWIIEDHLDLGRFGTLEEAKKAIDELINKKGRNG